MLDRALRCLLPPLLLFGSTGCNVAAIDLRNRDCPCGEGWTCNPETGKCDKGDTLPLGDENALIKPFNLGVGWTTVNSIQWTWAVDNDLDAQELSHYELRVTGPGGTTVYSIDGIAGAPESVNPELGLYYLPRSSGGDAKLGASISDGLAADTEYTGKVTAQDSSGRRFNTESVKARTTLEVQNQVVLFSEDEVGDASVPADFVRTMGEAYQGSFMYQWLNDACAGRCAQLLRRSGLDASAGGINAEDFASAAFVEMAIASDESVPSVHSQVTLTCNKTIVLQPLAVRSDGNYRLVQLPLRAFTDDNMLIAFEDIGATCTSFGLGGLWEQNATIRVDEVRLRY